MSEIKDIFKAEASSVQETLNTDMGVASFRIPIYQREYSWDEENIERILDDIREGIQELEQTKDSISFIGTMILVDEENQKEKSFRGKSLSIVDGQQRLTTLLLLCCIIFLKLRAFEKESATWPNDVLTFVMKSEMQLLTAQLFSCSVGRPSGPATTNLYDNFPRIVRQEVDVRASTPSVAKYKSLIADYIFQFCDYVLGQSKNEFHFNPGQGGQARETFEKRIRLIDTYLINLATENENGLPRAVDFIKKSNYRQALFPELQQNDEIIHDVIKIIKQYPDHPSESALRLIAFGNFLIHRVAITRVIADEERFAFAIFEALNTTGEPLTAVETFKPMVIQFENSREKKYIDSPSHHAFDLIEAHVRTYPNYDDQQRESRELVVLLALLISGEKVAFHLSTQRHYLRKTYQAATQVEAKRRITQALADLSEYRRLFWSSDTLPTQLMEHSDKEIALFCLDFIRNLKNSLAIPVLVRYWKASLELGNFDNFVLAVKAVTAFLVLRRAATGGTRGIDSDYRNLMANGGRTKEDGQEPLSLGILYEEKPLIDVDTLKKYLISYLKNPSLKIQNKESWVKRVSQQPLYSSGPASLSKFILLVAAHNSVSQSEKKYLLKKDKPHPGRDFLNLNRWRAEELSTIEHIAPQNKNIGWSDDLYEDLSLINRIGNLTLLPERHNSSIGDKPWKTKRIFYRAAAAETSEDVEKQIQIARDQGLDFGNKTNKMLREGQVLPVLASVGETNEWNAEIVRERSENIAELLWEELSAWLGNT